MVLRCSPANLSPRSVPRIAGSLCTAAPRRRTSRGAEEAAPPVAGSNPPTAGRCLFQLFPGAPHGSLSSFVVSPLCASRLLFNTARHPMRSRCSLRNPVDHLFDHLSDGDRQGSVKVWHTLGQLP